MKQFLVFMFLLCSTSIFAQDVIVKKDGSTIVCRVVELTSTEIIYKKWSDLNGSNYVMDRSQASIINYESGKKVNLSEATNLYLPNNQNDGTQQFNDKALLRMDYAEHHNKNAVRNLRTTGFIGGGVLLLTGVALASIDDDYTLLGVAAAGGAVAWTTTFLLIANHKKNKIDNYLSFIPTMQYEFNFTNGSKLSAGIDVLSNRTFSKNTLGLGLRYNF